MPPKEQTTTAAAPGGYDHLLIAKAPEITKADRQVRVRRNWHLLMCLLASGSMCSSRLLMALSCICLGRI